MTNLRRLSGLATAAGLFLIAFGFLARFAPLLNQDERMLRQWPTEDGYLMLTIARNMALGNGMSTADGELPTNGTQPLATSIWSLVFSAVDSDKESGVFLVQCIELLLSLLATLLLYRIARQVFREIDVDPKWAWLVAGLWYASGNTVAHSMNTLESGLYVTLVLLFVSICQSYASRLSSIEGRLPWGAAGLISVILALCFYARNDAALLIGAFCGTFVLFGIGSLQNLKDRFVKAFCIGLGTIVLSLPWLIYNVSEFGHIMPISGVAQSAASGFADNAYQIPVVLTEYLSIVLPVPQALEGQAVLTALLSVFLVIAAIALVRQMLKLQQDLRFLSALVGSYIILLTLYYGLLHGAPWFMDRYMYPASPFLAIVTVAVVYKLLSAARLEKFSVPVTVAGACAAFVLCAAMQYRIYQGGSRHQHQQVVEWVDRNVADDTWVGAIQTGTLGFFHDRTINLDGKVNPEALDAVLASRIPSYVVEKDIVVLADWFGIHTWVEHAPIGQNFEVLVADDQNNLSVLGRKDWSPVVQISRADDPGM